MNNTPYDFPQLLNFLIGLRLGNAYVNAHNLFNSHKKLICSELIINGFFKQDYNLFNKPAWNVLPADYDNPALFDIVTDIWLEVDKKEAD